MPAHKWNARKAFEVAKKCSTRAELTKNFGGAYSWLSKKKLLDFACEHMPNYRTGFTLDSIKKVAIEYNTAKEFRADNPTMYDWLARNDALSKVTFNFNPGRLPDKKSDKAYTAKKEVHYTSAKEYRYKKDFKIGNKTAFNWLQSHGLLQDACSHMVHATSEATPLTSVSKFGGIYFLYNNKELIYIGKSVNLAKRIRDHEREATKEFNRFKCYRIDNISDRDILELVLITKYSPICNKANNSKHKPTVVVSNMQELLTTEYQFIKNNKGWEAC